MNSFLLLLVVFVIWQFIANFIDYGQCQRKCKTVYPSDDITGWRISLIPFAYEKCVCYHEKLQKRRNEVSKRYSKIEEGYCGTDGNSYRSKEELELKEGVEVYHSGFCGECSNENDIQAMITTRMNLTGIAKYCGFKRLLFGKSSAMSCMKEYVGFTEGCSDCWVENMGCSITHCFSTCIISILMGESNNKNIGENDINSCLRCDEENCGQMFLECAGANRRKCSIETDIYRPDDELWKASQNEL